MGNCSCMVGLGFACSYIVALLFKLETAIQLKLKESTAPKSMPFSWKSCKKAVHPAPLKLINFSKAKTCELPGDHSQYIIYIKALWYKKYICWKISLAS